MARAKKVYTEEELKSKRDRARALRHEKSRFREAERKKRVAENKAKREATIAAKRAARTAAKEAAKAAKAAENMKNLNEKLAPLESRMRDIYNRVQDKLHANEPCDTVPMVKGACMLYKKGGKLIDAFNKGRTIRPEGYKAKPRGKVISSEKMSKLARLKESRALRRTQAVAKNRYTYSN